MVVQLEKIEQQVSSLKGSASGREDLRAASVAKMSSMQLERYTFVVVVVVAAAAIARCQL